MNNRDIVLSAKNVLKGLVSENALRCFEIEFARKLINNDITEYKEIDVSQSEIELHLIGIEKHRTEIKLFLEGVFEYFFTNKSVWVTELIEDYFLVNIEVENLRYKVSINKCDEFYEIVKMTKIEEI